MHVYLARASLSTPHRSSKLWPLHNCLCNVTMSVVVCLLLETYIADIGTVQVHTHSLCVVQFRGKRHRQIKAGKNPSPHSRRYQR